MIGLLLGPVRALMSIDRQMGEIVAAIEALREDVRTLHAGVVRIGDATDNLEAKVDELAVHVDALGTLAGRIGRLGVRRRADVGV